MKYYAVRKGRTTGVFDNWKECYASIFGYSGAVYKSFEALEDARAYCELKEDPVEVVADGLPYAYIDGSFSVKKEMYSYGGFFFHDGKTYILQGTGNNKDYLQYRNITGEVRGALAVIQKAKELGVSELNVFYDYAGIGCWALGEWACNTELSRFYRAYYNNHDVKIHFHHVKGHTDIEGNVIADLLAKDALEAKMTKKETAKLADFKEKAIST